MEMSKRAQFYKMDGYEYIGYVFSARGGVSRHGTREFVGVTEAEFEEIKRDVAPDNLIKKYNTGENYYMVSNESDYGGGQAEYYIYKKI